MTSQIQITQTRQPQQHSFKGSDITMNYWEWGSANAAHPTVLMLHATGFHARCWDKTIACLPEDQHVIAVDTRGHGFSENKGYMQDWDIAAGDIAELVAALGHKHMIGVGHSMGGHCLTQIASRLSRDSFARLVLVDPVIREPASYSHPSQFGDMHPTHMPIAKRRNQWAGWQEMFDRFKDRHPYSLWRMDVLEDYCRYGIVPSEDGNGFVLACPPDIEASIYLGSASVNITDMVKKVECPVTVLRAMERHEQQTGVIDFSMSPTWPGLADAFPNGRDVYREDLTHFIPMQQPDFVAAHIIGTA